MACGAAGLIAGGRDRSNRQVRIEPIEYADSIWAEILAMARENQRRLKWAASLLISSLIINPNSCVPKDLFFNLAASTQQSLINNVQLLLSNSISEAILGDVGTNG